jgi:aspartate racemase
MFALLGGMSWVSSSYFYRMLSEQLRRDFLLFHVDDTAFRSHLLDGRHDEAFACWAPFVRILSSEAVTRFAICCNSAHVLADRFDPAVRSKLIALPELALASLTPRQSVGLLCSSVTLSHRVYDEPAQRLGVGVVPLDQSDAHTLNADIFDHLTTHAPTTEHIRLVKGMCDQMLDRGVTRVVLGCTELSLLYDHLDPETTICPLRCLLEYLKNE